MPVFWNSISFVWTLVGIGALALIFAVRTLLSYRSLSKDAAEDWDYQVSQNMQDLRLTKEAYVRAYRKVNAPRGALYVTGALAAILVLTPVAFTLINSILWSLWDSTDKPSEIRVAGGGVRENVESLTFEPGNMIWGFFTFFGIVAIWALIGGWTARRYYKTAPGRMRDELIQERANFSPTTPLTVGANPAHIMAWPTNAKNGIPSRQAYAKLFENTLGLERDIDKDYVGSGHICDTYTDGSQNKICVHTNSGAKDNFEKETHPFFFANDFARHDDKPRDYTLIFNLEKANETFKEIAALGLNMDKKTGSETSRMCSFQHRSLEIFLYNT